MIQVVGAEDTREYEAALALRRLILQEWPGIIDDPTHQVHIIANAKCHGQQPRDIDVLLLAKFGPGFRYRPFLSFTAADGQTHRPEYVYVDSLCLAIEVKDHQPKDVRFIGTAVEVRYHDKWHNASEQSEKQIFSIKGYVSYHAIRPPWVTPLLWLRNVSNADLPTRPHPTIGIPITWSIILNIIGQITAPKWRNGQWSLDAFSQDHASFLGTIELFTKVLESTHLDRQRVERINRQNIDLEPIKPIMGKKLIILRGRGGTGKTVRLLQLAKYLCDEQGSRILILTYNKALVADIRRLLTILGIKDAIDGSTIQIQTVHSFLYSVLQGLGIFEQGYTTFLEDYERLKDEAIAFLKAGVVSLSDTEQLVTAYFETFRWDYIFIDEGQDWPDNERDLLMHLYPYSCFTVVDGVDQLVRSHHVANWRSDLKASELYTLALKKCLRMKAGLARFVSSVAGHLGLLYNEWEANQELPGGRVIILEGPYFSHKSLHDRLIDLNKRDGNSPVDMLFCVPPSLVVHQPASNVVRSQAALAFERWSFRTWDGAAEDIRDSYPTEIDQLRVVQYDSCRGLEGWVVVNLGLDRFYEDEYDFARSLALELSTQNPGILSADASSLHLYAARWLLIPLTRAIDTLVIQLDSQHSPLYTALKAAATEYSDFVEWIVST